MPAPKFVSVCPALSDFCSFLLILLISLCGPANIYSALCVTVPSSERDQLGPASLSELPCPTQAWDTATYHGCAGITPSEGQDAFPAPIGSLLWSSKMGREGHVGVYLTPSKQPTPTPKSVGSTKVLRVCDSDLSE